MTDVVSIWIASAQDEPWAEAQSHLMDAQERAHAATLSGRETLARHYILGRVLRRVALQHQTGIAGQAFRFVPEASGRPQAVLKGFSGAPLGVSLSHSQQYVVVATGPLASLGVDVEASDRLLHAPQSVHRLMTKVFTAEENQRITAVPELQRPLAVMQQWALKEAACKALGWGLRGPWREIAPHVPLGPLGGGQQRVSTSACELPLAWRTITATSTQPLWCVLCSPSPEFGVTDVPPPIIALGACSSAAPQVRLRGPLNLR